MPFSSTFSTLKVAEWQVLPADDHGADDREPPVEQDALGRTVFVRQVKPEWYQDNQDCQDDGRRCDGVASI